MLEAALLNVMLSGAPAASPPQRPAVAIGVAQANINDDLKDTVRYGLELRFRPVTEFELTPVTGITTAANGATFVYGDLRRTFRLSDKWSALGSLGLGRYDPDDVIDLGNMLEFRTGVIIAYHLPNEYDLELAVYHFSNGGIGRTNPGTEMAALSISIPIGKR